MLRVKKSSSSTPLTDVVRGAVFTEPKVNVICRHMSPYPRYSTYALREYVITAVASVYPKAYCSDVLASHWHINTPLIFVAVVLSALIVGVVGLSVTATPPTVLTV